MTTEPLVLFVMLMALLTVSAVINVLVSTYVKNITNSGLSKANKRLNAVVLLDLVVLIVLTV